MWENQRLSLCGGSNWKHRITDLPECAHARVFADLRSDSWGASQILPQVWSFTLVQQLHVHFHERKIQQISFSVFDEILQVMCNKFL